MIRKPRSYRYHGIVEQLAGAIEMEVYRHGDRLPSVRQLMATEGVSQSTAVRVLLELEAQGLAFSKDRSGFFARAATGKGMAEREREPLHIPGPTDPHMLRSPSISTT